MRSRCRRRASNDLLPAMLAALVLPLLPASGAAQVPIIDDAGRSVSVPAPVTRVFAAGAPAEVLLYTLVPEALVGRNHAPSTEAQAFMPPSLRKPVQIRNLPEVDDARYDAELLALRPQLYVDYGDVNADYIAAVSAVASRTGVSSIILDGAISRIPDAYRRLGPLIGVPARGEALARQAERLLADARVIVASSRPVRVHAACSRDALTPCYEGERGTESLRFLGVVNSAGERAAGADRKKTLAQIRADRPDVILATDAASAAALKASAEWSDVPAVAAGRVYSLPELPFSWAGRPPSVNRLPGVLLLAYRIAGRPVDDELRREIRSFYLHFYHVSLTDLEVMRLLGGG